jgi:DNA-binding GntR family transcriptional regulator
MKSSGSSDDSINCQIIYTRIYEAIMENQLKPNYRLKEENLTKTFNVSRTIIREVLQRLARDKMVYLEKNRGATVYYPSEKESKDIFFARRVQEKGCVEKVISNITIYDLVKLTEICKKEEQSLIQRNNRDSIKYSAQFHVAFTEIAKNKVITDIVKGLAARTSLIISAYGAPLGCSCGNHHEFVELLKRKDKDKCLDWIDEHFSKIETSLIFSNSVDISQGFDFLIEKSD